ncbi:MAG: ribosome-associated translation inhibitor RaiA [Alphaproteobacteria bacterium]|nr:ribosome-associated translation inhibitor RaiA [Alphaproteobacteria bacterium]
MQLSVKGKQIDVGEALRQHVQTRLTDVVGKYFGNTLDSTVTFSREAHLFRADITVHAGRNIILQGFASASEPYPAFDMAADRIAKRLSRYKERLKKHHKESSVEEAVMAPSFVLNPEQESAPEDANDNPVVVAEMTTPIETLTVGEAVMRLDLGDLPALMFRSRAHGGLNMIYRRPDGHIGWVDPSQNAAAAPAKMKAHG